MRRLLKIRMALLFTILTLVGQFSSAAMTCAEVFGSDRFQPQGLYSFVNMEEKFLSVRSPLPNHARFEVLGAGVSAEARLYVHPKDPQRAIVRKLYLHGNSGRQASHDVESLQRFKRLLDPIADETFHVAEARLFEISAAGSTRSPLQGIEMPYIPGRTINDLLHDPSIPFELKEQIRNLLHRKMIRTSEILRSLGYSASPTQLDRRHYRQGAPDNTTALKGYYGPSFILKSDNIIVDPYDVNKMTIVDPY